MTLHYRQIGLVVILVVASAFLYLAQSATWLNRTVFDESFFTQTIQTNLQTEQNRNAIATTVVDKTFADRPILRQAIGDRLIPVTSGLLASDISNQIIRGVSDRAFRYVTTPNRSDIVIDLVPIKSTIGSLNTVIARASNAEIPDGSRIPDQIMLLDKTTLPDVSRTFITMRWAEPILWLFAIGLFALYIYIRRLEVVRAVYIVGLTIAGLAAIGLLFGSYIPPPIATLVPDVTLRPLVQSTATDFVAPFTVQMWWMLVAAIVGLSATRERDHILRLIENLRR